jgi:hypothetical protein
VFSIERHPLPADALLADYVRDGHYTDCYSTEVSKTVSHTEYVEAFYTTCLFKVERKILRWLVGKPSTDQQARQLAAGELDSFAAWHVEKRNENQILMCDFRHRTRSWLMVSSGTGSDGAGTRLYFGSAVVPFHKSRSGTSSLGMSFKLLAGFHKAYSVALLFSAKLRIESHK